MINRMDRIERELKKEILLILQEEINDPRIRHVTITRVEVNRDLRMAKVFFRISDDESMKKEVIKGLRSACSFIRGELADRMTMKFIPGISFREDREDEKKEAIDGIFERIEKELQSGDARDTERTNDEQ
ncbi:MAG: 30S ribosome-binding factor RbfA [Candidatus Omnitrophota bacterium]|nr:30S ribosome-binding factor RbfA [Candidatus Omnitrophota bacterium]